MSIGLRRGQVALGSAITDGERDFATIVAIDGANGKILSPCGNCRPVFSDYMPDCFLIVQATSSLKSGRRN